MSPSIHPLVQNPHNSDAVTRHLEIDDMLLNAAPPVPRSDRVATRRPLRRFGQIGAGGFDEIGVT